MVYFWGSTFHIKCTKVPLLLQAISYLGEAGRKSLGLKCSGRLWASKFLIKFHPTLSSFLKTDSFWKSLFEWTIFHHLIYRGKRWVVKDGEKEGRNMSLMSSFPWICGRRTSDKLRETSLDLLTLVLNTST